jgi:PPM family protein phosphatase
MAEAQQPPGKIQLRLFGRTDVGRIREHNEDNFLVADLTAKSRGIRVGERDPIVQAGGNLFAVCDGMGGAAAGEIASQMAVDLIYERLASAPLPSGRDELARNMVASIEEAGLKIYHAARSDSSRRGMGTTSTVAVVMDERLFLGQVGDSRGYLLRGDQFVQVTRDQSLVNQLIEAGQLTEEEAETFEHNNIILQALGTSETVQVDVTFVDLRVGDTLLLCSDGLSGMIRDAEMKDVLMRVDDPIEACRELTDRANAAGGHDNITVVLVKFGGDGLRYPAPEDRVVFQRIDLKNADTLGSTDPMLRSRPSGEVETSPRSDEATRETRDLRVSHTMIGSFAPTNLPDIPRGNPSPRREDPVDIPTHPITPILVGAIVVVSVFLLVAVAVFMLR